MSATAPFAWLALATWGCAALASAGLVSERRPLYAGSFLGACAGNVGVVAAETVQGFYAAFALLTVASYGLVAHARTDAARRAARTYLALALGGELLLLAGLIQAAGPTLGLPLAEVQRRLAEDELPAWASWALWAGLGVKAGVLPFHAWLPLAHPVAPSPASAVLSGTLVKAGVLGWLRLLPLGAEPRLGETCVVLGLLAAPLALARGVRQEDPKTALAWSTVAQVGLLTVALGIGLQQPAAVEGMIHAVSRFALHHGLAKASLFLGTGIALHCSGRARTLALALLVLPAWDLAGGPFSGGAEAKHGMDDLFRASGQAWASALLPAFSTATAALTFRAIWQTRPLPREGEPPGATAWMGWALLLGADAWLTPGRLHLSLSSLWPLPAGVALALLAGRWWPATLAAPPGDPLRLPALAARGLLSAMDHGGAHASRWMVRASGRFQRRLSKSLARLVGLDTWLGSPRGLGLVLSWTLAAWLLVAALG